MKARFEGLGKRLLAYTLMVVALVILLRVVIGVVTGFIHTLILVALVVFAVYALHWASRLRSSDG